MRYSHHHNLLEEHDLLNPNNTGLYSNYPLGPAWFPLREKTKQQEGWDSMFIDLGKTFFKGVNNPYAVYMGVGKIGYLELPSTILDVKPRNRIRKKGLKIYLLEPLSTYNIHETNPQHIYANYELDDIADIRARELDSISIFAERNELPDVTVYAPDYRINEFFGMTYPNLNLYCSPVGWIYPATMKIDIDIPEKTSIRAKFWCGNWKYGAHRHLIASYLAGRFDSNEINLSWIYSSSPSMLKNNLWFNLKKLKKWENPILNGAQKLDLLAPQTMGVKMKRALDITEQAPDLHTNTNPKSYYDESFCAIVNETRFAQATGLLTEKIMMPMLNCKPFIMVGPPGNLEYMKRWGFETFSDYWDESYDKEEQHDKRLAKILGLIDWIGSKSIEELQDLYERMLPTLMFNQVRILDLQEQLLAEPITKNILFKRLG
ncbi:MAG: hypothetical protein CMG35_12160 [Candidatus Marinimicrobia bacterium]|jgi:hypothetical protein|nr:hypothetical protein [Candidatus Neomarinimicrobiota bacterium]MBO03386.1 hypothetical protein [Candidatus Neomarinimicrobiota bacterium]|tara:strand:- start:3075 stop:4370 length:1296 start_codon:yes stop_codon:yes gene_type:complete